MVKDTKKKKRVELNFDRLTLCHAYLQHGLLEQEAVVVGLRTIPPGLALLDPVPLFCRAEPLQLLIALPFRRYRPPRRKASRGNTCEQETISSQPPREGELTRKYETVGGKAPRVVKDGTCAGKGHILEARNPYNSPNPKSSRR